MHYSSYAYSASGRYETFYPESNKPSSADAFGKLVTPQAFKRVKGLLDNTKGKIVIGGETDEATKYIAPTVVSDVHPDDSLMSEYVSTSLATSIRSMANLCISLEGRSLDPFCPSFQWRISTRLSRLSMLSKTFFDLIFTLKC
jgi:hypothetical protein